MSHHQRLGLNALRNLLMSNPSTSTTSHIIGSLHPTISSSSIGALSTSTHGSGLTKPSFPQLVVGLELATVDEAGKVVPLVAFTDERLPMFPDVPTLKEKGGDFSYFMQRAVVGAPGMSDAALAYYTALFDKVYKSEAWQKYKSSKSLMGDYLAGAPLKDYWKVQRDRHTKILKASGAIK